MRMKKLLMFLVLLTVSVGSWADPSISTTNGVCTISLDDPDDLDDLDFTNHLTATKVVISCESDFTNADYSKINQFTSATALDMSGCANADNISNLNMPKLQYLRLPDGMTSAEDVAAMANLKTETKNTKLKVVGAFDGSNTTLPEVALYSFKANELSNFSSQMMNLESVAMVARLAGTYGDKDLMNNNSPVFGWTPPCIWDFTGASFSNITTDVTVNREYYAYDDPFREGETSKPGNNYKTNSFVYFSNYSTKVVDIKLPTGITVLPPHCLNDLGAQNVENNRHKEAYKAYYNATDTDLAGKLKVPQKNAAIIPTLTIPDNYVKLDYECGNAAHIKHLVISGGVKIVEGGAFYDCLELEDLDFGAGLSNCYLGDRAFHGEENSVMKHIALSEGIVSIGNQCFNNAQQLESIRLPQSLIYIGDNAFDNCLALNSITIPENVDKIGKDAFKLCPFTDIFLTTTDPNKIPAIFTGGNSFDNWGEGASFHHGHYDGWEGLKGVHPGSTPDNSSWDDAVDWYFVNCNGLPVLHYPTQLREKVRADISEGYHASSSDTPSLGLPTADDMHARETAGGANVGTSGQGIYTRDGWAQFMLMKEYTTNPGGDVYKKKYEDVWYTMCFPFDLSDEQLAAAFNETFNIVDFSGVEVTEKTETNPLTLTLHFNTVAQTTYKDENGAVYLRKLNTDGTPVRENHGKFSYNVYYKANADGTPDTSEEYHHAHVSAKLSTNKTKTFAPGTAAMDLTGDGADKSKVVTIDGILATAGHPYMIHPAIGTSKGNPRRCDFSGIEWKGMTTWPNLFEQQKRVVDLGVPRGEFTEGDDMNDHSTYKPDADNYMQPEYSDYAGQTYTFIGNPTLLRTDVANYPANLQEPTVENGGLQVLPSISDYTSLYPKGPAMSAERKAVVRQYGEKMTADDEPTEVQNPANAPKYAEVKDLLMAERVSWEENGQTYSFKYYEDLASYDVSEFFTHWSNWAFQNQSIGHNHKTVSNDGLVLFKAFFNDIFNGNNESSTSPEGKFAELKALAETLAEEMEPYNQYQEELAAYNANVAAWNNYEQAHAQEESEYQTALSAYTTAVNQWRDAYNTAESANETAIATWQAAIVPYQVYIPKNAYFLGRKGTDYPKYYREIAENPAEGSASTRKGGAWNQFTAIIIPNEAAINGIEKQLDGGVANNTKGLNMVFDEGFMGEFNPTEIKDIVAEAEEKGQKVEYMNIVYSINGEIVGRGSQSLSNLPQGMYIINGKKYLVK